MPVILDPDAAAVFKAFQEAGRPPYETVAQPRHAALSGRPRRLQSRTARACNRSKPLAIPAPHGSIPARVYTPKNLRQTDGLAPVLVFLHGGGWVIGDLDSHDVVCRKLAHEGAADRDLGRLSPRARAQIPRRGRRRHRRHQMDRRQRQAARHRCFKADGRRRQRRRQPRRGGGDRGARRQRARDRRPGADLSRHRFCDDASLAQRAGDQHPADAFGDPMVQGPLSRRRRHRRLARLAGARHHAGRPAAGLCADRRRRSPARRRRRIRRAAEAGRRGRHLPALSRPIPRLLHHGQIAATGQCRRQRDRRLAEGATEIACPRSVNLDSRGRRD